ncbi:MAG TPA: VWA domain-containing protein [Myxococcota bacterium]|jgi:hypothetical protein|nr:VWA domain-containing protein [Myxococcota bacterium]
MKPYTDRHLRRKRGIAMVWMAVAMPGMIALTGIALDMGNVALVRTRLQNYVDAEAISALKERFGKLPRQVELQDFVGKVGVGKDIVPQSGIFDFKSSTFTQTGSLYLQPLQVPARHAKITGFEVPLLFGPIVGVPSVKLDQEAVAFLGRRQVVIVQDVSGSMGTGSRMPNARNADRSVILEMETQQIAGDQVGLVAFDDGLVTKKALTPLANGGAGSLVSIVDGWGPMGGTHVSIGIKEGASLFPEPHERDVERILIVVGDGEDCYFSESKAEADKAAARDIHVFTIMITGGPSYPGGGCDDGGGPQKYFAALPRNRGTYKDSPDGANLASLLVAIVAGIPLHLVQ